MKLVIMQFFFQPPDISSPLGPYILLSALFYNSLGQCSSLNVGH
jgi:hypothetical protein